MADATAEQEALRAKMEENLIAQEYKIWKKNTPFLYDFVMTHGLEWPSLTGQWLPPIKELNDGNKVGAIGGVSLNRAEQHELLLGTHTTGDDPNYLMIASVNLPREDAVIDNRTGGEGGGPVVTPTNGDAASAAGGDGAEAPLKKQKTEIIDAPQPATNYNDEKGELGGYSSVDRVGKIDIRVKIPHDGEVNRARYMPQNHFVVATRGPGRDVYVYDVSRHPSEPKAGDRPAPEVICRGHGGEGYGLSWCGVEGAENTGKLATCAEDKLVCLWDVREALATSKRDSTSGIVVEPYARLSCHTDVVEDVDWHNRDPNLVGSCGDDRLVCLWDARTGKHDKPVNVIKDAHAGDVNSMEFHPVNEHLLATGGSDKVVKLWDMRNLKAPLQTLVGHLDQVYTVHWSPHNDSALASCSADRRIALWDLSRIGQEQSPEDAEDGPPELLFLHGGHTARVNDFGWNPNMDWCLAGVSEDNVLQVWSPNEDVYADDEDDDEEEEGEDPAMKQRTEILGDDELE